MDRDLLRARPHPACFICGTAGTTLYEGLRDRLFDAPGIWTLKKCPQDGLIWLDPMPMEEDLAEAYRNYYTHEETSPPATPASWPRRLLRTITQAYLATRYGYGPSETPWMSPLAWLSPRRRALMDFSVAYLHAVPGGRLIEVGCGQGTLLRNLQDRGWRTEGVEIDPVACDAARRSGLTVRLGTMEAQQYPPSSFDAVVMSHVIEHVPHPDRLLAEGHRVLKPGGRLVVITPNSRSWGHSRFGRAWLALDPPRHLHLFNPPTLSHLARRAGFARLRLRTTIRVADDLVVASSLIRKNGRYRWGDPGPRALRFWARGVQGLQALLLLLDPGAGEEIVLIGER